MAPEINMPHPMCLLESTPEGELRLRQEALDVLSGIHQPMVVVTIVGLYRKGKSYLMNRLAGKKNGFSIGSTIKSHTKGIWMWCIPHPEKSKHTLVLLDTEGLGDVERGDSNHDNWILTLAVFLSSVFVYNSMGTIDQQAIEQLYSVLELSNHIKEKSSKGNNASNEGNGFCPTFIWAVRDFTLDLELGGQQISTDEYLENALQLIEGSSGNVSKVNLPRECIRRAFPSRKCFVFDRPAGKKDLKKLKDLEDEDLEPDFVEQTNMFCQYIFKECKTKTLQGGHLATGKVLAKLVLSLVDTIRSGTVPCIMSTVCALARIENSEAVQKAVTHYEKQMREQGKFPTATLKCFLDLQKDCERQAIQMFMTHAFMDDDQEHQKELKRLLKVKTGHMCTENEKLSVQNCRTLLQQLFTPIERKISQGFYSKPGGCSIFEMDQTETIRRYTMIPRKGLKADEILQEFLQSKESVRRTILQTDQTLTAKENQIAAERQRAQAIEAEIKRKEKMDLIARQNQQRAHEEDMRRIRQRMEEDLLNQQRENERRMRQQLEEQEARLQAEALRQQQQQMAELERLRRLAVSSSDSSDDDSGCVVM
ncbi:guanylate-binding protein 1-like [Ambystoma mexicanum]|uniref:guanylate-binding protein 1-like n=1 Tax=Ambystoma mexicanum TaxID=8296 RepID=UPI0037E8704D